MEPNVGERLEKLNQLHNVNREEKQQKVTKQQLKWVKHILKQKSAKQYVKLAKS